LLAFALIVAACASLTLRDPPRIDVVGVRLDRVEGPDAYFSVDVMLTNPAAEEVVIGALQGTFAIEGENVAEAALVGAPVRVPGNGTASAELTARTGMDAVLRAIAAAMRRGATIVAPGASAVLHYTIEGSATLAGGMRVPFRRTGQIGEHRP
jgi:hypothetical protein